MQGVDASQLTVIPGLWESHTHEWISGKFYGDRLGRLWMAYGVTSLNSVGDPVYRAMETREAFGSGERVGPRFFATGEAIDGERVYYNFMRPTYGSDEQFQRELDRAQALDYDMVKTYVRLRHEDNVRITQWVHDRMRVWTASHYMLSPMAYGEDGMTHVSATTRTGFAYTRSSAGISYEDMRSVFKRTDAFDISTTFNSSLYRDDPTMVEDPRLLTLNTPWDQAVLVAKRNAAVTTDQTVSLDSLQKEENTVAAIRRGGGVILAGTDSPLDNVATALHLNLRAQVHLGGLAAVAGVAVGDAAHRDGGRGGPGSRDRRAGEARRSGLHRRRSAHPHRGPGQRPGGDEERANLHRGGARCCPSSRRERRRRRHRSSTSCSHPRRAWRSRGRRTGGMTPRR